MTNLREFILKSGGAYYAAIASLARRCAPIILLLMVGDNCTTGRLWELPYKCIIMSLMVCGCL